MENLATCLQPSFEFSASGELPGVIDRDLARAAKVSLPAPAPPRALVRVAQRVTAVELEAVRMVSRASRSTILKSLAIACSWLGNGWIYPLLFSVLVARWGVASLRIAVPAGVIAVLLHCVYPLLKKVCGRRRPFQMDSRLQSLLETLDEHSFPSGHTMTLAGVLTPVVLLWPAAMLSALVVGGAVAWSRVATAHHYPSDVLAGAVLGVGVGYPITIGMVSLWS